jgi:hypothetical protein
MSITKFDVVKTRELRHLCLYGASYDDVVSHVTSLREYRRKSKEDGEYSLIPVEYEVKSCGRLNPVAGSINIHTMNKSIRNFLLPDSSIYIDIKRCIYSVFYNLSMVYDFPNLYLKSFMDNYDRRIQDLGTTDKGMLFGSPSTFSNMAYRFNWVGPLVSEVQVMAERLKDMDDFKETYEKAVEKDNKQKEDAEKQRLVKDRVHNENIMGKFLMGVYFKCEARLLELLHIGGVQKGMWDNEEVAFINDGLIVFRPFSVDLQDIIDFIKVDTGGWIVDLAIKPFDKCLDVDMSVIPTNLSVVDMHKEAADLLLDAMHGRICRSGMSKTLYVRDDDGLWTSDKEQVKSIMIKQVTGMNIKLLKINKNKDGEETINHLPFSCDRRHATQIVSTACDYASCRDNLPKDLVLGSEGKVAFQNGYWEFLDKRDETTGVYGRFVEKGIFDTAIRIERKFPRRVQHDIDDVYRTVINPIFDNSAEGMKDIFLLTLARAFAGRMDKLSSICFGPRNCGKSVLFMLIRSAIENYGCNLSSSIFTMKNGFSGDSFREDAWVFDCEYARIAVISEGKTKGETNMSGDQLKRFQSGKEGIMARMLHQSQREVFTLAQGFFLLNDVPDFEPQDAIQQCLIFKFHNQFVTKIEKDERPFRSDIKLRENVEPLLSTDKYKNAMLWIMLESYGPEPATPNAEMITSRDRKLETSGKYMYEEIFDVTYSRDSYIKQPDALRIAKKHCPGIRHEKILLELEGLMKNRWQDTGEREFKIDSTIMEERPGKRAKQVRVYRGLQALPDPNVGGDLAYSTGFMP